MGRGDRGYQTIPETRPYQRQDHTRPDNTRQDKRQDHTRPDNTRQDKRQDKRPDKTIPDNTRHDQTRPETIIKGKQKNKKIIYFSKIKIYL